MARCVAWPGLCDTSATVKAFLPTRLLVVRPAPRSPSSPGGHKTARQRENETAIDGLPVRGQGDRCNGAGNLGRSLPLVLPLLADLASCFILPLMLALLTVALQGHQCVGGRGAPADVEWEKGRG